MDEATRRAVKASIADVHAKVLAHFSRYEPKPTGANVLESFDFMHKVFLEVSQQAMQDTQLSLFDYVNQGSTL